MAKSKLHQIIAVLTGKKTRAEKLLGDAHHGWKPDLIMGLSRTYEPLDAEGEKQPPENKRVQVRVSEVAKRIAGELAEYFDVQATQETGNTIAAADAVVDGKTLLKNIPVGALLFLEKRLTDLRTFVQQIPTLPTDKEWSFDEASNAYVTPVTQNVRTSKVPTTHVKFQPTEHQPGQAEIIYIDKVIGYYSTRHFSGAILASTQAEMLDRVEKLLEAVKVARETANSVEVDTVKVGQPVMDFIFGKLIA